MMLLVLSSPVHKVILDEVKVGQVIVDVGLDEDKRLFETDLQKHVALNAELAELSGYGQTLI
ncbi:hypothetical protein, partial [Pseudomonas viridiflava]|uniref:hypothetical protein n=1 Tax=Pseudomonas viridiflava TaxID=33069 RepID=UPI00197DE94F